MHFTDNDHVLCTIIEKSGTKTDNFNLQQEMKNKIHLLHKSRNWCQSSQIGHMITPISS